MRSRASGTRGGRPGPRRRPKAAHRRRARARCQWSRVSGRTGKRHHSARGTHRLSAASTSRSAGPQRVRRTWRRSTRSSCRSAKNSIACARFTAAPGSSRSASQRTTAYASARSMGGGYAPRDSWQAVYLNPTGWCKGCGCWPWPSGCAPPPACTSTSQANYEAGPLDQRYTATWESLPAAARWWAAASMTVGPAPPIAPGVLGQAALALLLSTARHPALARPGAAAGGVGCDHLPPPGTAVTIAIRTSVRACRR